MLLIFLLSLHRKVASVPTWFTDECASVLSRVRLFATPWTVTNQAPLSTGFSRQEYWSGLPFPPPGELPDPGIELESLVSPALAGGSFATGKNPHHLGSPQAPGLNASTSGPLADCLPRGSLSLFAPWSPQLLP